MTKQLETSRVSSTQLISTGPAKINAFEDAVADIFGINQGTELDYSPFIINDEGDLEMPDGSKHTIWKGAGGNYAGFRVWDPSVGADNEAFVGVYNDEFIVLENTGTYGGSPTWRERLVVALGGTADNTPGQSILNHTEMPTSLGSAGDILAVKTGGTELEFVSSGALAAANSAAVEWTSTIAESDTAAWQVFDLDPFAEAWDNNAMWDGTSAYFTIPSNGIYLITMSMEVQESGSPWAGLGFQIDAGAGIAPGMGVRRKVTAVGDDGYYDIISGSWTDYILATQVVYPKLWVYQNGSGTITIKNVSISVTEIAVP